MGTAVGVKAGTADVSMFSVKDCEVMDAANQKAREEFVKDADAKIAADDKAAAGSKLSATARAELDSAREKAVKGGLTISSAKRIDASGASSMMGASSGTVNESLPGPSADNTKADQGRGEKGVLCEGTYHHPAKKSLGCAYHAEAKIVNTMSNLPANMRDGSLLLKIDWRRVVRRGGKGVGTGRSGMPCGNCYAMLCHASKKCNIQIVICDAKNQPQPLTECDNKKNGYQKLQEKVNGTDGKGKPNKNQSVELFEKVTKKRKRSLSLGEQ
ncbi:hypothetical protein CDL60_07145 [Roseateles noduli]|nr:hypothetical protein CDL60_07145 [Roseateles noduli]